MKYIYTYIILLSVWASKGQNLVLNPSFETYTICPNSGGQIEYALPWTAATTSSSTDYYNSCSSVVNVPNNGGFQMAHTGSAYAGLFISHNSGIREYLQGQLNISMVQDKTYYVEFFVNLNDGNWASACNNIAANLSILRPTTNTWGDLQMLTPHIINSGNPIIDDRIDWVKVSGCYTAQGGEKYITIGNFFNNANTQFTGTTTSSYYFVDDVLVEEITGSCVTGVNELALDHTVNLLPNPANGLLSVNSTYEIGNIELSNIAGQLLLSEQVHSKTHQLQVDDLAEGIYFVKVFFPNGMMLTRKMVKQ